MISKRLYLIVGLLTVGFLAYVAGEPLLERVQESSVEQSIREAYNDGYLTKDDARRMVGEVVDTWPPPPDTGPSL
jgi:hypothetical protein